MQYSIKKYVLEKKRFGREDQQMFALLNEHDSKKTIDEFLASITEEKRRMIGQKTGMKNQVLTARIIDHLRLNESELFYEKRMKAYAKNHCIREEEGLIYAPFSWLPSAASNNY